MIVTVRKERSNQLNYVPTRQINEMRNSQYLCGLAPFAYRAPLAPDRPKERESCPNRSQISAFPCTSAFPKEPAPRAPDNAEFCQPGQNH